MIDSFDGKYEFLSNFYKCDVEVKGITYTSTEHAFQAMKTLDKSTRKFISELCTPGEAKRWGRKVELRHDWERVKISVMYNIVEKKFTTHKNLGKLLMETEGQELIEGNYWNDTFYGVCNGKGRNELGKILMKVREELRMSEGGIING